MKKIDEDLLEDITLIVNEIKSEINITNGKICILTDRVYEIKDCVQMKEVMSLKMDVEKTKEDLLDNTKRLFYMINEFKGLVAIVRGEANVKYHKMGMNDVMPIKEEGK